MSALLLDPHGDDAVLFSCWNLLRYKPHVVCVLRSQLQDDMHGIKAETREAETKVAFQLLGFASVEQWEQLDTAPDWTEVRAELEEAAKVTSYDRVFAPASEAGGHDHHNKIAEIAHAVFGERVTFYTTYKYGGPKTRGKEVPYEPWMVTKKLQALACFRSQIEQGGPHRFFVEDLREYTAA